MNYFDKLLAGATVVTFRVVFDKTILFYKKLS